MNFQQIDLKPESILAKAKELVYRYGINILVIDPYNCMEHSRAAGISETEYISRFMTLLGNFAKINNVHIFLVAHPTKLKRKADGQFPRCTLNDISGSAHFWNKTDNGMIIERDFQNGLVNVYLDKIRFKFVGKVGDTQFIYHLASGRYAEQGVEFQPLIFVDEPNTPQPQPETKILPNNDFYYQNDENSMPCPF